MDLSTALDTLSDSHAAWDLGESMTADEAAAMAAILRHHGRDEAAAVYVEASASLDE